MSQGRAVLFAMSGRRLALPLYDVRRIVPLPRLQAAVGAPRFVEGFFDFQGRAAAALRLDRLFDLDEEPLGLYAPLIVLHQEEPLIALHVARVTSIVDLPTSSLQAIGEGETFNGCVVGRFGAGGDTAFLLSVQNLLLAEERARLAAHMAMRDRRLDALRAGDGHAA